MHYIGTVRTFGTEPFFKPLHCHTHVTELLLIAEGEVQFVIDGKHDEAAGSLIVYNQESLA
ncbi:MAG: hypothetical protein JWN30_2414 [Bacilli bacterium]|nr:hypothetical protein [Bacilli bacterium]